MYGLTHHGKLIVELDKALYGLKKSALLWYQLLCDKLGTIGFVKNRYEQSVFNRVETDGSQSSLCVHVDDFMITAASESILDHVLADINNVFGDMSVVRGRKHDYLFDFSSDDCLHVSMLTTVDDILSCARTGKS